MLLDAQRAYLKYPVTDYVAGYFCYIGTVTV